MHISRHTALKAEEHGSIMSSKKRKVLSDTTNAQYNLIPTTILRKLVYNPSRKLSSSVLQDPEPGPERSSRSVTSVGSTNVASGTVSPNRKDSTGNNRSKNAEHARQKQRTENSNKENEAPDVIAAQKLNDKGKAIAQGLSTPHERVNWKQRETLDPCKGIIDPFMVDVTTIHKRLFADLGINLASASNKPVMTKNDDDVVVVYSCPAKAMTKNENIKKEASSATPVKSWKTERPRNRSKENESSDVISAKYQDDKVKSIIESLPEKRRETRGRSKGNWDPFKVAFTTVQEGLSSADVGIKRESSRKKTAMTKNAHVVAYSCPAKARNRNEKSKTEAAKSAVKSLTEPRPDRRKKNHAKFDDELPRDFVEKQRAYFKEVDEFELIEEEASEDDLE